MDIVKPLTSKSSSSERFLVCMEFNGKVDNKQMKHLEEIYKKILEQENADNFLGDIFPGYKMSDPLREVIVHSNMEITNSQMVMINKMVHYINGGNFFGDLYHSYRANQIEATEYWIRTFYPTNEKDFKNYKEKIQKEILAITEKNKKLISKNI